jgi:cell division protein FtsB
MLRYVTPSNRNHVQDCDQAEREAASGRDTVAALTAQMDGLAAENDALRAEYDRVRCGGAGGLI